MLKNYSSLLSLTPGRSVEPPSLQVLGIHSVIGRILHLSAPVNIWMILLRDLEKMENGEVMQTGLHVGLLEYTP
ncbi:hypothetical protein BJX63DRAFT_383356 [Aspergillus granulosus]|uniref:Uncharacterized protein n=1 Tax=Aspergillus granulosus TaxID=176169 RepID=A0ABR4HW91_9EURO